MENLTLKKAQAVLAAFPADDGHHTVQHSKDVLYVGQQIAGNRLTQALECALLLHDIGHFFKDDDKNPVGHGLLARLYLEDLGVHTPEILLPVAYHEANESIEKKCLEDDVFQRQDTKSKIEILWNCQLVCEADIISHMHEMLKKPNSGDECFSWHFLDLLGSGQLPTPDMVVYRNDQILYLLCGLSLVHLPESVAYLKRKKIVPQLVSCLPNSCQANILKITREKYEL